MSLRYERRREARVRATRELRAARAAASRVQAALLWQEYQAHIASLHADIRAALRAFVAGRAKYLMTGRVEL